jgi:hypothetical protein
MNQASGHFRERRRDAATRLREAGKGELVEELRLNGEIDLGNGQWSSTSLCLTDTGLYLVLLRAAANDVIDLLAADRRLRYRTQLLGDRLEIDHWRLSVPWGRAEQARRIIGLARIRRAFGPERSGEAGEPRREVDDAEGPWAWSGPLVDEPGPLARAWLLRWLDADERLLVWQTTDTPHTFDSPVLGKVEREQVLVITERRQGLVALSPVGDLWTVALPDEALEVVSSTVGRATLRAGGHELRLPLGEEKAFAAIACLPGYHGVDRLRGVARLLWLRGHSGSAATRAAAILDEIAPRDPFARLARALLVDPQGGPFAPGGHLELQDLAAPGEELEIAGELVLHAERLEPLPDPVFDALREIVEHATPETGQALVRWWRVWALGPELGEVLVEHLCELGRGGLEVALPLHEQLRPLLMAKLDDDPEDAALLDFVFVEHLLALGRAEQALAVLANRRQQLPSEQLQDLLPPSPARGGQRIRIELYELAASAHAQLGDGHVAALAELTRLQPLVTERVEQLLARLRDHDGQASADDDALTRSLLARAERVREILDEDGFAPKPEAPPASESTATEAASTRELATRESTALERPRVRALDEAKLELLRHPAARADGALGRLQGALAKVAVPDCSVLKSYCERANLADNLALARALTDATVILGLGGVEVFVSRGDKSVGLRAYEGDTSFLLIGGDHVNPKSDAFLDEDALRFAVAAELAHLRYAHSRVTSNEVWAGTVDLGLTGLGMLIAAAPMLKGLKAPAKHLLDKVGAPAISRWRKKLAGRDAHTLASDNSQVIAAHRAMQLSADRAGLLVCGDPRAAIRAMFTVHPASLSLWPLVGSHGLRAALTREISDPDERERLEDLAVRVAALLSFYLSSEYAELRRASNAEPEDAPGPT